MEAVVIIDQLRFTGLIEQHSLVTRRQWLPRIDQRFELCFFVCPTGVAKCIPYSRSAFNEPRSVVRETRTLIRMLT
jgi:hypothetical protein